MDESQKTMLSEKIAQKESTFIWSFRTGEIYL